MKKILLILALSVSSFATDRTITCADSAGLLTAITASVPGDRIILTNVSGTTQCNYTLGDTTWPKKTITHPTSEAVLSTTVASGQVTACSVTSGGSAYTVAPLVSIPGGGGRGATAHVTISGGAVNSCVVDTPGVNYTKAPTPIVYSPENFIQIIPSNASSLPALGRRLDPTSIVLPKLTFTGTSPIIFAQGSGLYDGASYYYFRGLEITQTNASLISLTINANTTSHIVFEQMYMYPQPCPNSTPPYNSNGRITLAANGWDIQLKDSYLPCWYGLPPGGTIGQTSTDQMNLIADGYGTGIILDNNLLTGWFNPFFFGGGDPPASAAGQATMSSRSTGQVVLSSPPGSISLIGLEVPFEGNTVAISSITRAANVVTVVTSGAHGFLTGAYVYPKGVTDTSFNVVYDSSGAASCAVRNDSGCRLITVDNSTTFHYTQTGANASSSGGVIVPTTCGRGPAFSCWIDTNVSSVSTNTVNFAHAWVAPFAWGTFDVLAGVPGLLPKASGGAQWDGTQVIDSDVTRNLIQHNTAFDTWIATNNGNVSKGCPGEVKFWYGGRMEGNWCAGFPSPTNGFNANTAYGSAPWVKISDVHVEGNVWDRFIGIGFGGFEYDPIGPGDHIVVKNNLWAHGDNNNVSNARANVYGPNNIANYLNFEFSHNTVLTGLAYPAYPCSVPGANGDCYTTKFASSSAKVDSPFQLPNVPAVIFKDNIIGAGNYGFQCGVSGNVPVVGATGCFGSLTENHNIIVSNSAGQCVAGSTCPWTANQFPFTTSTGATGAQPLWQGVNGSFPSAMFVKWSDVGLTDPNNGNYVLKTTSPGHNGASDGTDVGANYNTINTLLGPDNPTVTAGGGTSSFTISPTTATIGVNRTQQMTASSPAYWFTNVGTIDSNGLYTAPATQTIATITGAQQTILANNLNTQSNWQQCGNCGDSGGPNPQPNGTFIMTAGDPATFSAAGNYPFNNGFWWYVMQPAGGYNSTVDFQLSFDMQFPTQADKNASQAVEFELQKNVLDQQYSMAWQFCYACGNKMRVFNKTGHFWEDTGLTFDPAIFAGGKWVSVQTVYHLTTGTPGITRHVSISLNGVNHVVNIDHASTPAVESDYLHPAFQLDSNGQSPPTPYVVKVRNFDVGVPTGQTATATITSVVNRLSLSPSTWPFSQVNTNQLVSQQYTLSNTGPVSTAITGFTQAGWPGYVVTQNSCSTTVPLAAGSTCNFTVQFSSAITGGFSGNITITDSSNGTILLPFTTTVVAPTVQPTISPTSVTLGVGEQQQFTTNFTTGQIWTASAGTVSASGFYTAPSTAGGASVTIKNSASQSATAAVTVISKVVANPTSMNFGSVVPGQSVTSQTVITNNNIIPVTLTGISVVGSAYSYNSALSTCHVGTAIPAQTSCFLTIGFLPPSSGSFVGTVTIADSAKGSLTIPLAGATQNPVAVSVSPTSFAWGNIKTGTTSNTTFTVSNFGPVNVTVSTVTITGTGFSSGTGTCFNGMILSPQATCTVIVTFAPVSAIAYSGNLAIVDNSPHTTNAALSGTGTTPPTVFTWTFRNLKIRGPLTLH
jgi:hypothetical protein